jgi:superfamily II DNA or RNA helicase
MNPELAYIREALYLPKKYLNCDSLIRGLTFTSGDGTFCLAKEEKDHIKVPRNFKTKAELADFAFDFVDESSTIVYPDIDFKSNIKWWSTKQEMAHKALSAAHSGIFNLNPGRGKTVHALKRIEENRHPALIVVTNSYIAEQWLERINDPNIKLTFPGKVGFIGDGKFDWKHPICIAMIQSLANKVKTNSIPSEFSQWFGSAYYDEGHHLGAKVFSTTADLCLGRRICLTATAERIDGFEFILKYYMGNIIYSDLTWELTPEIIFNTIESKIKINKHMSMPIIINKITEDTDSNMQKLSSILADVANNRKILCVSERVDQLTWFHEHVKGSSLIIGDTPKKEREGMIRNSQVSFVITKLGLEGLDVSTLDCLHLLSPIGADKTTRNGHTHYIGARIMQLIGRVMRVLPGKANPKVVIHDNVSVEPAHELIFQLKSFFKKNGFDYSD